MSAGVPYAAAGAGAEREGAEAANIALNKRNRSLWDIDGGRRSGTGLYDYLKPKGSVKWIR